MLLVSKIKVESRYSTESDLGIGFFFEKISEIMKIHLPTPANFRIFSMHSLGGRSHTMFSKWIAGIGRAENHRFSFGRWAFFRHGIKSTAKTQGPLQRPEVKLLLVQMLHLFFLYFSSRNCCTYTTYTTYTTEKGGKKGKENADLLSLSSYITTFSGG